MVKHARLQDVDNKFLQSFSESQFVHTFILVCAHSNTYLH